MEDSNNFGVYFDKAWYVHTYKDVPLSGIDPVEHFSSIGWRIGRDPSLHFSTQRYLKTYPDVEQAQINPLVHYLTQGALEGRVSFRSTLDDIRAEQPSGRAVPSSCFHQNTRKVCKIIAFYLPQFHEIEENNHWWGQGFTEWTNVRPATPLFDGHYQPHVPVELGYYSLSDSSTQQKQVQLARQYGIDAFCFYFYWFKGKRLLEAPLLRWLEGGDTLTLSFCLCWANENWTRRWDGLDQEVLISQSHSPEDDIEFIKYISKYLIDPRYIKVNEKPLLLVYRPDLLPNARKTVQRWRQWCRENGVGEIFVAYTQSFEKTDPSIYGFDAAVEFPPNSSSIPEAMSSVTNLNKSFTGKIYDWRELVSRSENYTDPQYKIFRTVNPGWDNTARKKLRSSILLHSSPRAYSRWLYNAITETAKRTVQEDERIVFVNAWNEWAEGAHLEPDSKYGFGYLDATRFASLRASMHLERKSSDKATVLAVVIHAFYIDVLKGILSALSESVSVSMKLYITTPEESVSEVQLLLSSYNLNGIVISVPNCGRDALPFLKVAKLILTDGLPLLLKVHTKKSLHRSDGDSWRNDLFAKLVTPIAISSALGCFLEDSGIGAVFPQGHVLPMSVYWGSNRARVTSIANRLGYTTDEVMGLKFPAGNMFFAKTEILYPLLALGFSEADFEPEQGQLDGTLAHAIERIIPLLVNFCGLRVHSDKTENSASYQFADAG